MDLVNRIYMMISKAVIRKVNDSKAMQIVQAEAFKDELRDVERFQNYGFTSSPHAGSEAVILFLGGNRDHGVAIAIDDRRYRLSSLEDGEVAIYSDEGDSVILKRGNNVEINTGTLTVNASTKIQFNTPLVEAIGDIKDSVNKMSDMRTTHSVHTHPGDSGGSTGVPG